MPNLACPAQSPSYKLQVQEGRRYLLCMCGRSRKRPLCDGAHAGSGTLPFFYTASGTGEVQVCGCNQTTTKPLCDANCVTRCCASA